MANAPRLVAPRGGTAVYYKRTLYCSPIDIPPLINLEAPACKLPMTGHGILIIISVYLPPKKSLLRSDIKPLLALEDTIIPFGDLNSKNTDWCCNTTNASRRAPFPQFRICKPCRKKGIKCFSAPLLALLVAIFNACIINCYFPEAWKEAVIIGIPKPGTPRDLPINYRPISLLSGLSKLFEKVLKSLLNDHLLGNGVIINEQFEFRLNYSCPQQVLRLVEHISEFFKRKRKNCSGLLRCRKGIRQSIARRPNLQTPPISPRSPRFHHPSTPNEQTLLFPA
ncbi:Probable RNA-directed DNA polymerase from transposon BS [Eumeta japonica]|uniref:Probable RNA-directed DNA polymerase from transposon BS n=1 Tax=Eumeta variegata TaxID=151549 RepID=A0A4C1V2X6_EUMVA|nr:Probable RNA-directed DNA polymerase from transposon BS [Eumeta japonica]